MMRLLAALAFGLLLGAAPPPAPGPVRPKAVVQSGHSDEARMAAWSPDGRFLVTDAVVLNATNAASSGTELIVWDVMAGRVIDRLSVPSPPLPNAAALTKAGCEPDDHFEPLSLAFGADNRVTVAGYYALPNLTTCTALGPQAYASQSFDLAEQVWRPIVLTGEPPSQDIASLPPSPDGQKLVAVASGYGRIVVGAEHGHVHIPLHEPGQAGYNALIWWPDGRRLALVDYRGAFSMRDLETGLVERRVALTPLLPHGFLPLVVQVDVAPDRKSVTLWFFGGLTGVHRMVPLRFDTASLAVGRVGAPIAAPRTYALAGSTNWPDVRSGDGRFIRVGEGVARTLQPDPPPRLDRQARGTFVAVDVTRDSSRAAFVYNPDAKTHPLRVLDIDGMVVSDPGDVAGSYDRVHWIDDDRLAVWDADASPGQTDAQGKPRPNVPLLVIEAKPGGRRIAYDPPCLGIDFIPGGMLAHAICGRERRDDMVFVASFDQPGWREVGFPEIGSGKIVHVVTASAAPRAVILTCDDYGAACLESQRLWLLDTKAMRIVGHASAPISADTDDDRLSPDGLSFLSRTETTGSSIALPRDFTGTFVPRATPIDRAVLDFTDLPSVAAAWQQDQVNTLRFVRAADRSDLAELIQLPGGNFTVTTPFGTYDTSGRPERAGINWLFPDAPFTSLPVEIFMRDYFEPNLLRRRLDCTPIGNCASVFRAAPEIGRLDRTLPDVRITGMTAGPAPGTARVTVTARAVIDPAAPVGRQASGLYNLRLFRDDRLVAQEGAPSPQLDPADLAGWRTQTKMPADQGSFDYIVRLPPAVAARKIAFSAYAFNQDRVKSLTARASFDAPPRPADRPRLYLLTIGIDGYGAAGFPSLRYAGADAQAMMQLLQHLGAGKGNAAPFDLHAESVIGTAADPATRARIQAAFAHLREARPDDVVIVTYAGHGYTDARGRFSLVPADVRRDAGGEPANLITAADLTEWLAPVDAGEITLVIDACHSAASVSASGFKPGPMGDPGLGQLAYDKGIRILAASQPDQYAMELSSVGHGLLTYALVTQGAGQGKADLDGDGFIRLDEWLRYAVAAVQTTERPADTSDSASLVVNWGGDARYARQKPALFDYVGQPAEAGFPVSHPASH